MYLALLIVLPFIIVAWSLKHIHSVHMFTVTVICTMYLYISHNMCTIYALCSLYCTILACILHVIISSVNYVSDSYEAFLMYCNHCITMYAHIMFLDHYKIMCVFRLFIRCHIPCLLIVCTVCMTSIIIYQSHNLIIGSTVCGICIFPP